MLKLLVTRLFSRFPCVCLSVCLFVCFLVFFVFFAGQNNEKFVPNPQHSSPLALSMLRFVGRLMGLSLRTRLCLPFQLPGLIWKRLLVCEGSGARFLFPHLLASSRSRLGSGHRFCLVLFQLFSLATAATQVLVRFQRTSCRRHQG